MSLGDILQAALSKKEKTMTVNKDALARMIMAARETGRTNRDVYDMLTATELEMVLNHFTAATALAAPKRQVWMIGAQFVDRKIDCIKTARALGIAPGDYTGTIGLKEAKDFVEGSACLMLNDSQIRSFQSYLRSNFPHARLNY